MRLTAPEWDAYIKEVKRKKCGICLHNIGTSDWPNCEKEKSWPRHGICKFMEDYMPEVKLEKEDKDLIKSLWDEKMKLESDLERISAGNVADKFDLSIAYVRQLWREFENE